MASADAGTQGLDVFNRSVVQPSEKSACQPIVITEGVRDVVKHHGEQRQRVGGDGIGGRCLDLAQPPLGVGEIVFGDARDRQEASHFRFIILALGGQANRRVEQNLLHVLLKGNVGGDPGDGKLEEGDFVDVSPDRTDIDDGNGADGRGDEQGYGDEHVDARAEGEAGGVGARKSRRSGLGQACGALGAEVRCVCAPVAH